MTEITRRRLVAAGGLLTTASTVGCLGLLDTKSMVLRALPATGTETDVKCRLSSEFVSQYPKLERVLTQARKNDDWAKIGVSEQTGTAIGDALVQHCDGETRGLYRYDGQWYFISLRYRDAEDHQEAEAGHHDTGTATTNGTTTDGGHSDHEHTHYSSN